MSYSVEYAKTGRSKCKRFKEKIPKDAIRVGVITADFRSDDGATMTSWHCLDGFVDKMVTARTATIDSADELDGLMDLSPEDQEKVRSAVDSIAEIKGDSKLKKAHKERVKARKPAPAKKRKQKSPQVVATEPLVVEVFKSKPKEAMAKFITCCLDRGLPLPQDYDSQKKKLAGYLVTASPQGKSEGLWRLRDAFKLAAENIAPHLLSGSKKKKSEIAAANTKNQKLVDLFMELSSAYFEADERFKGVNSRKVARALADLEYEITDGAPLAKGKTKVPGVGKSTAKKIDEILATGTCDALEKTRSV